MHTKTYKFIFIGLSLATCAMSCKKPPVSATTSNRENSGSDSTALTDAQEIQLTGYNWTDNMPHNGHCVRLESDGASPVLAILANSNGLESWVKKDADAPPKRIDHKTLKAISVYAGTSCSEPGSITHHFIFPQANIKECDCYYSFLAPGAVSTALTTDPSCGSFVPLRKTAKNSSCVALSHAATPYEKSVAYYWIANDGCQKLADTYYNDKNYPISLTCDEAGHIK